MATVFLAQDLKHQRKVAIKVMKPELAAAIGAERFLREITIAANLNSPHIVTLFDSGEADGLPVYVMPYIEGNRCVIVCDARSSSHRRCHLDVQQVTRALAYANARGIVHRDIKPANILLIEDHALVADFGGARVFAESDAVRLTYAGWHWVPGYMSPEQAAGDPGVDIRSDIYALGCVLYETLAGENPLYRRHRAINRAQHLSGAVPEVRRVRALVPEHVDARDHACPRKLRADRFTTPQDFAAA